MQAGDSESGGDGWGRTQDEGTRRIGGESVRAGLVGADQVWSGLVEVSVMLGWAGHSLPGSVPSSSSLALQRQGQGRGALEGAGRTAAAWPPSRAVQLVFGLALSAAADNHALRLRCGWRQGWYESATEAARWRQRRRQQACRRSHVPPLHSTQNAKAENTEENPL